LGQQGRSQTQQEQDNKQATDELTGKHGNPWGKGTQRNLVETWSEGKF
jgi:hypothetical protein